MINSFTALQVPHDGFSLMFQDSKAGSNFVFCGQIKTNTDIYGQLRTKTDIAPSVMYYICSTE